MNTINTNLINSFIKKSFGRKPFTNRNLSEFDMSEKKKKHTKIIEKVGRFHYDKYELEKR
jgi:hypothetical protein